MTMLTLIRRQLRDVRWSLAFSVLAFFGLAILWNWGVSRTQFPPPEEPEAAARTAGEPATNDGDSGEAGAPGEEPMTPSSEVAEVSGGEAADGTATTESASAERSAASETEPDRRRPGRRRGLGIYIGMGVPADTMFNLDDPPTLLMQVCMANHPLILLTLMGWAIARASAAVAGEIERGTLDLTLTRPVRRSTYLASQVIVAILVFALLGITLILGHLVAPWFFEIANPPRLTRYVPATLMVMGLALAIFGYALLISARDLSRGRAGILALGVTLAGVAGVITSRQLEGYEWLSKLSVFEFYAPVGISVDWSETMGRNLAILLGIAAVGVVLSFVLFLRRDLPSNA